MIGWKCENSRFVVDRWCLIHFDWETNSLAISVYLPCVDRRWKERKEEITWQNYYFLSLFFSLPHSLMRWALIRMQQVFSTLTTIIVLSKWKVKRWQTVYRSRESTAYSEIRRPEDIEKEKETLLLLLGRLHSSLLWTKTNLFSLTASNACHTLGVWSLTTKNTGSFKF